MKISANVVVTVPVDIEVDDRFKALCDDDCDPDSPLFDDLLDIIASHLNYDYEYITVVDAFDEERNEWICLYEH